MIKPRFAIETSEGVSPDRDTVKKELLVVWDAYSPLSLSALTRAFDKEASLEDVGISERKARACTEKYNALIVRGPGTGPLVAASEAGEWLGKKMLEIVDEVTRRSQAAGRADH